MEKVLISIDKNLLTRIDEEIQKTGEGATRSGFIRSSCEYYLKIKRGISNALRKKEIDNELS